MASDITDFTRCVAGNVKAELARRDLSGVDLIPVLRVSKNAVYARLRGQKSFEVNELDHIAKFLGVSVETLVAAPSVGVAA